MKLKALKKLQLKFKHFLCTIRNQLITYAKIALKDLLKGGTSMPTYDKIS